MNPIRFVGQVTPFIAPNLTQFEKKAPHSTPLSRLPYLSFFENWFKYPLLVTTRFLLALAITTLLSWLTLGQAYQDFVMEQVIDQYLPKIELQVVQNSPSGNILEDIWQTTTATAANARQVAEREIWRAKALQVLAGEAFVIFRGIFIFLLYSLLFWLFGNDVGSLERQALQNQAKLGDLAKTILRKIQTQADYLYTQRQLHPEQYQQIQHLTTQALNGKKPLQPNEIDYLLSFIVTR